MTSLTRLVSFPSNGKGKEPADGMEEYEGFVVILSEQKKFSIQKLFLFYPATRISQPYD